MKRAFMGSFITKLIIVFVCLNSMVTTYAEEYQPTWESLSQNNDAPEWMKDAKFGIYTHWGLQTELGKLKIDGSAHYYNQMYMKDKKIFNYHLKTYGDQNKVGYKDLIDTFKAKDFDADRWAKIFHDAGARFAGMVVVHHDNVAMYDSKLNKFNVVNFGPKRDITFELQKAYRKKGMPFLATFHNLASWSHSFLNSYDYDGKDPKNVTIYNEPHKRGDKPVESYLHRNVAVVKEVIEKYNPDGVWFDFGFGNALTPDMQREIAAFYYNRAKMRKQDVAFIHKHGAKVPTGMLDTERHRPGDMQEKTFMNDESIGIDFWFYNLLSDQTYGRLPDANLIHMLVDLVSKNGVLLLNIAPDADGNIPPDQKRALALMGNWLKVYGGAIYKTRPWKTYGEGPFMQRFKGGIVGRKSEQREYTSDDIRFSRSKDNSEIYAIVMGAPTEPLTITSMKVVNEKALHKAVELSGAGLKVSVDKDLHPVFFVSKDELPQSLVDIACVIQIPAEAVSHDSSNTSNTMPSIKLNIDHATLIGDSINLIAIDTNRGIRALGSWTNPEDSLSFSLEIPSSGMWALQGEADCKNNQMIKASIGGETKIRKLNKTRGRGEFKKDKFDLGCFEIAKGKTTLNLSVGDRSSWKGATIYKISLRKIK